VTCSSIELLEALQDRMPPERVSDWTDRQYERDADNKPLLRATITMYFDDHGPPHFHARAAGRSAKVEIETLEVLASELPRRELRLVLAWAEMHAAELGENWRRAREGATLSEIEPLR
jgi:hypothetical protein